MKKGKEGKTTAVSSTQWASAVTAITENEKQGGIEIKFDAEPSPQLQPKLRAMSFRHSRMKSMWYGDNTQQARDFAEQVKAALPTNQDGPDLLLNPSAEAIKTNLEKKEFSFVMITLNDGQIKNYVMFEPSKPKAEVIANNFAQQEFGDAFLSLAALPKTHIKEARTLFDEGKIIFPNGQKMPTHRESVIKGSASAQTELNLKESKELSRDEQNYLERQALDKFYKWAVKQEQKGMRPSEITREKFGRWFNEQLPDVTEKTIESMWQSHQRILKSLYRWQKKSTSKAVAQPYSSIYKKILRVIPDLPEHIKAGRMHGKSQQDPEGGLMDLNYDFVSFDKDGYPIIALSHYFKQNGDMVADPDMQIRLLTDTEMAEALTFQDQFGYQEVYPQKNGKTYVNLKLKKSLNSFLNQWLTNIIHQGHKIDLTQEQEEVPEYYRKAWELLAQLVPGLRTLSGEKMSGQVVIGKGAFQKIIFCTATHRQNDLYEVDIIENVGGRDQLHSSMDFNTASHTARVTAEWLCTQYVEKYDREESEEEIDERDGDISEEMTRALTEWLIELLRNEPGVTLTLAEKDEQNLPVAPAEDHSQNIENIGKKNWELLRKVIPDIVRVSEGEWSGIKNKIPGHYRRELSAYTKNENGKITLHLKDLETVVVRITAEVEILPKEKRANIEFVWLDMDIIDQLGIITSNSHHSQADMERALQQWLEKLIKDKITIDLKPESGSDIDYERKAFIQLTNLLPGLQDHPREEQHLEYNGTIAKKERQILATVIPRNDNAISVHLHDYTEREQNLEVEAVVDLEHQSVSVASEWLSTPYAGKYQREETERDIEERDGNVEQEMARALCEWLEDLEVKSISLTLVQSTPTGKRPSDKEIGAGATVVDLSTETKFMPNVLVPKGAREPFLSRDFLTTDTGLVIAKYYPALLRFNSDNLKNASPLELYLLSQLKNPFDYGIQLSMYEIGQAWFGDTGKGVFDKLGLPSDLHYPYVSVDLGYQDIQSLGQVIFETAGSVQRNLVMAVVNYRPMADPERGAELLRSEIAKHVVALRSSARKEDMEDAIKNLQDSLKVVEAYLQKQPGVKGVYTSTLPEFDARAMASLIASQKYLANAWSISHDRKTLSKTSFDAEETKQLQAFFAIYVMEDKETQRKYQGEYERLQKSLKTVAKTGEDTYPVSGSITMDLKYHDRHVPNVLVPAGTQEPFYSHVWQYYDMQSVLKKNFPNLRKLNSDNLSTATPLELFELIQMGQPVKYNIFVDRQKLIHEWEKRGKSAFQAIGYPTESAYPYVSLNLGYESVQSLEDILFEGNNEGDEWWSVASLYRPVANISKGITIVEHLISKQKRESSNYINSKTGKPKQEYKEAHKAAEFTINGLKESLAVLKYYQDHRSHTRPATKEDSNSDPLTNDSGVYTKQTAGDHLEEIVIPMPKTAQYQARIELAKTSAGTYKWGLYASKGFGDYQGGGYAPGVTDKDFPNREAALKAAIVEHRSRLKELIASKDTILNNEVKKNKQLNMALDALNTFAKENGILEDALEENVTGIIRGLEAAYWKKEDNEYAVNKVFIKGMAYDQARLREAIRGKLEKLPIATVDQIKEELSQKFKERRPFATYEKGLVTIGKKGDARKAALIAAYVDDMIIDNDLGNKRKAPVMTFLVELLFSESPLLADLPQHIETPTPTPKPMKKKSQYELNKEIEAFIDEKDKTGAYYNEEERNYLRQYTGSGGLLKEGASGRGALYEYYTPEEVVKKMWDMAYYYGYDGGNVLEPSVGTGHFLKYAPKSAIVFGFETNHYSARIAQILYPHAHIHEKAFETLFFAGNIHLKDKFENPEHSLVIGNPPYGEFTGKYAGMGEKQHTGATEYDQYFILRGLDVLKKGGLLVFLIPSNFMTNNDKYARVKEKIAAKAELLDCYRLPGRLFQTTDIGTDILVLKRI